MSKSQTKAEIMIVDDDQGMIDLMSMRLQSMGYDTRGAASGEQALQSIGNHLPDMVITDLRMEEMDGLMLFEKIHERWPSLPVVVLTAHGSIPQAVSATQRGVFSFLTKPVDKEELGEVIKDALQYYEQPHLAQENWEQTIKTRSTRMHHVLDQAKLLAGSDVNVLITGESGTGKELVARALHKHSRRSERSFIALNCSAIPNDMLESELFGHVKGAFTGATRDHMGLVTAADGGVLFLDEIGDMPLPLQSKLLRVLQEKRVRPVGDTNDIPVDIRVFSATHKDLQKAIEEKQFRDDLYYRLNVVNLHLPALRERKEDILFLANYFLHQIARRDDKNPKQLSPQAREKLLEYQWPGNIRQLENVMEQVVALCPGAVISETLIANALPAVHQNAIPSLSEAKREFEREYVAELLRITQGSIPLAAKLAGRNRSDFYKIVNRHHLDVESFKNDEIAEV